MSGKTAITGVAGYIGGPVAAHLRCPETQFVGIDRVAPRDTRGFQFIEADLVESDSYVDSLATVDTVVHLAAAKGDWGISTEEYFRDNVLATRALIEAGRKSGVRRWLFFSTVSVLGPSSDPLAEDAEPRPINDYGKSKLECEVLFHELAAEDPGCEIVIIRPSVVFGPKNPWNTNIFRLIDAIYRRRFVMIGDGAVYKTTSYLDNLVAATMFLMDRFKPGVRIYHCLDEPVMSTEELVSEIYRLLGISRPSLRLPLGLTRQIARVADIVADLTGRDLPITSARIEKFCTDTNFESRKIRDEGFEQPVSMEDALEATVHWYTHEHLPKE